MVFVPWTERWLSRFNRRFDIDKSSYDGRFKSRLGAGFCIAGPGLKFMEYNFVEVKP